MPHGITIKFETGTKWVSDILPIEIDPKDIAALNRMFAAATDHIMAEFLFGTDAVDNAIEGKFSVVAPETHQLPIPDLENKDVGR